MQIKPSTARGECKIKNRLLLYDARINIFCGVYYYAKQKKAGGTKNAGLGMYYAGPTGYKRAKKQNTKHRRKVWAKINRYIAKVNSVNPPPVKIEYNDWWFYGIGGRQ
jgi:soluble lytic murein transglycosylase-like protein